VVVLENDWKLTAAAEMPEPHLTSGEVGVENAAEDEDAVLVHALTTRVFYYLRFIYTI
jgi:hypothetical protein